MIIDLYTDGSCYHKDRVGGWGFVAFGPHPDLPLEGNGYELDTTISRMELMAAIQGLAQVGLAIGRATVHLYSDSQYVVFGATDKQRARNHNNDLWDLLDDCEEAHLSVTYKHVRGHSGHAQNERVDHLAGLARKEGLAHVDAK